MQEFLKTSIVISYLSLILLLLLWNTILSPSTIFPKSLVLITLLLPLLVPLKGILNLNPKTLLTASLLVLVYFALGISNLLDSSHSVYLSTLKILLTLGFIATSAIYLKFYK